MWFNQLFPFVQLDPCSSKKYAQYENDFEFQNTFVNLLNLALDRIHFKDLPETCNERFFKLSLILAGQAALVNDNELGYLSLYCTPAGAQYNVYGEYPKIYAYGWNGFMREYTNYMYGAVNDNVQAVICRDNPLCYPLVRYIMLFAHRLTSTMRTIDTTAKKLKTPYFIVCEESQKSTIKKILKDIDFNEDSIITNKSTTPDMFQILPTGVREGALESLWNHYNNLDGLIRAILGIKSATNQDKKERLIVDEVNSDNQISGLNMAFRMKSYELFCETVNDYFGLDISVEFEDGEEYVLDGLDDDGESPDDSGDSDIEMENRD